MNLIIKPDGFAMVYFTGLPWLYISCVDMLGRTVREMMVWPYKPYIDVERSAEEFTPVVALLTARGSNGEEWVW